MSDTKPTVYELQDLAEKAWPDLEVLVEAEGLSVTVAAMEWDNSRQYAVATLARINHPRAAEAMRAALLVLATKGAADE